MTDVPRDTRDDPDTIVVLLVDRADRLGRADVPTAEAARGLARVAAEAAALWPPYALVLGLGAGAVPPVVDGVLTASSPYFTDIRRLRDLVDPLPSRLVVLRPASLLVPADELRHVVKVCADEALDLATIDGIAPEVFYVASRRLVEVLAACGPVPGAVTIPEAVERLRRSGVALADAGVEVSSLATGGAAWARAAAALPPAAWRGVPDAALLDAPSAQRTRLALSAERAAFDAARRRLAIPDARLTRASSRPRGRTLVVVASLYQTGAHFAWMALVDALSPRDVAFAVGAPTALHDALVARGFEVYPLADGLAPGSGRDAATLDDAMRRVDPSVVHLDGAECVPLAAAVAACGARVVQHVRLNTLERFRPAFIHAGAIVAVSSAMQDEIAMRVGTTTRVVLVPDGVCLDAYAPREPPERLPLRPDATVDCLVVGRVEPAKAQLRVIDIFEALAARRPARLTVVGPCGSDASYCDAVLDRIDARPGDINWQPFSIGIAHLYRRAHVVLVGSRNEALGMVGLEALAAGALLVAHRSTGYASIVDPSRREGLLFDQHQSPAEVASLIAAALDQVDTYTIAARRKACDAFDARQTAQRLTALWAEVRLWRS